MAPISERVFGPATAGDANPGALTLKGLFMLGNVFELSLDEGALAEQEGTLSSMDRAVCRFSLDAKIAET